MCDDSGGVPARRGAEATSSDIWTGRMATYPHSHRQSASNFSWISQTPTSALTFAIDNAVFGIEKKKKTNCKWRLECIFKADTCQDQVEKFLLGIQDARIPGTAAPWPVTNVDGTRPIIPFVCLPSFFLTFEMRKVSVGQRVFNMIAASVCNLRFPNS